MSDPRNGETRRVLIASANPLFGKGLEKLLLKRWGGQAVEIRLASSIAETLSLLERWRPSLVIMDYDDQTMDRSRLLSHFVAGEERLQVMLVSLQQSGTVVVYDRRTLSPAQVENWLDLPGLSQSAKEAGELHANRSKNMKHFAIVGILVVLSTALVYYLLQNIGLLPLAASAQAQPIDQLFNLHFFLISFLFSLIVVFLGYSLVVFRQKPGQTGDGVHFTGSNKLEVLWTLIPLATVTAISFFGAQTLKEVQRADPQALEVKVTAGQWFWSFEYPEYGITSQSLYLPVNQQVLLKLTSRDVIHSFWVPEFRVKQDVLPGENLVKELRITPTQTGSYTVRCAELCGGAHAYMNSPVLVVTPEEFKAWVNKEMSAAEEDPAARGKRLAAANGCIGCHTLDGKPGVGPTWLGLYGKLETLSDGSTVTIDETYLHTAIVDPNAQVPQGYPPNVMPSNYGSLLSDQQIADIIAFIQSLK